MSKNYIGETGFYKTKFYIMDVRDDRDLFEGYTHGEYWNGWACPYFTLEEGKRLIAYLNDLHKQEGYENMPVPTQKHRYDAETDQFYIMDDNDEYEPLIYGRVDIEGLPPLYEIGSWYWVWSDVLDDEYEKS
jgi:hypothetical protein